MTVPLRLLADEFLPSRGHRDRLRIGARCLEMAHPDFSWGAILRAEELDDLRAGELSPAEAAEAAIFCATLTPAFRSFQGEHAPFCASFEREFGTIWNSAFDPAYTVYRVLWHDQRPGVFETCLSAGIPGLSIAGASFSPIVAVERSDHENFRLIRDVLEACTIQLMFFTARPNLPIPPALSELEGAT